MFQIMRTATILFSLLTILTGVVYPLTVTAFAQVVFPREANGGLFRTSGKTDGPWTGSGLIGQSFSGPHYFWGRPSATAPVAYNSLGGSGSNQATTNPALVDAVKERIAKLRADNPNNDVPIPIDLVTASASGLDPHISEAGAYYQIERVARARQLDSSIVTTLVRNHVERPTLGILGQSRVNVLKLNLALDALTPSAGKGGDQNER
jgi:potassium-transporting ATPase KdpC subunit